MNIKDFYKTTKLDLEQKTKDFNFKQKQIKEMIDNAKKNGEEIDKICDDLIDYLYKFNSGENDFLDTGTLESNILKIKNIIGGKKNGR